MRAWKKRKIPSRKSKRKSISPTRVQFLESASWTGELPPVGPQFSAWLDQNTHSLKIAAKYGDVESVDELIELLKTPCIQPHHPDKPALTISVCEQVASKIRSIKPHAANDDIADMLDVAATNIEKEWIPFWQKEVVEPRQSFIKDDFKIIDAVGELDLRDVKFGKTDGKLRWDEDSILYLNETLHFWYSNEDDYDAAAKLIENSKIEKRYYSIYADYDESGYDYWSKQNEVDESNYIRISVKISNKGLPMSQVDELREDIEKFYKSMSRFEFNRDFWDLI